MAARGIILLAGLGLAVVVPVVWSLSGPAISADTQGWDPVQVWSFRPVETGPPSLRPDRQFLPRSRATRPDVFGRRTGSAVTQRFPRRDSPPLLRMERAGARKAVPITRGTELGLKFRPDQREPAYGPGSAGASVPGMLPSSNEQLHSQFRPTKPRRRPTYEELQAERRGPGPVDGVPFQPVLPYPPAPLPAPLPGLWNRW